MENNQEHLLEITSSLARLEATLQNHVTSEEKVLVAIQKIQSDHEARLRWIEKWFFVAIALGLTSGGAGFGVIMKTLLGG